MKRVVPVVALLSLAACGGGTPSASPSPTPPVTTTSAVPTTAAPATGQGHAVLTFTGAFAKTVDEMGEFCFYYYPSERKGVAYRVGERGADGYDLTASDDEGNGRAIALLNTPSASYGGDARRGRITLALDGSRAELDLDLKQAAGTATVHLKGTITCPPLS